jgi:hypothetical protein
MKEKNSIYLILLFVLLVIGGGAAVFFFRDRFTDDYENEADRDIDRHDLSYDQQTYIAIAKRLYRAVKGWGTDEDAVLEVIKKLQTKSDWQALVLAYGEHTDENDFSSLIDRLYYELEDNRDTLNAVRSHLHSLGVEF